RPAALPRGEAHARSAAQPLCLSGAADCRGSLAGASWGNRHDRHFGRTRLRRAASIGRIRGRHRNQPRPDSLLGRRRGDGGAGERRGVRAARYDAADIWRRERLIVPRRDRCGAEPHRHMPALDWRAARRRAVAGWHQVRPLASRIRSLRRASVIRTLWYYIVLVISGIVHSAGSAIAGLLRVPLRRGGVYDWAGTGWARDVLRAAGTPVIVEGMENIPHDQPLMYASNHSSMFDIWALFA